MSDLSTIVEADRVEVRLDAGAFPRDAVYAAAFAFMDRCYVRLDKPAPGSLGIVLRAKAAASFDGPGLAAELQEELAGQRFRQRLADDGRELVDAIAIGAPGGPAAEPSLDDLLASPDLMDDPLGIAESWEKKHASKVEGT